MLAKISYENRFMPDDWQDADGSHCDPGIVYAEYYNYIYVVIDLKPGIEWEVMETIANSISFDTPEGPFNSETHWQ